MNQNNKILVVDDDQSILASLRLLLKSEGFTVTEANSPQQALYFVKQQDFDIVLLDLNYNLDTTSGVEGLNLISEIKQLDDHLPLVVMTGWGTIDVAVQAMQRGAGDFIQKPWENDRLLSILHNQIKLGKSLQSQDRLKQENQLLKQALDDDTTMDLVAQSGVMRQLLDTVLQIAHSDINVLITGENGTGKSLLAKYIHHCRCTANGQKSLPFVAVNMGAISENLFESEMFGHTKGAFTDAKSQRIGRFELADSGTLFLDEIGNIPLSQQAKLLRVIEEQQFEKVGSSKTQQVNVRVISATNADIKQMVADQTFRMDLLYRLNTFELTIPPLRQRLEDIPLLAERFIHKFAGKYQKPVPQLSEQALSLLQQYDWPGNIRELSHLLERAVLLSNQTTLCANQLSLPNTAQPSTPTSTAIESAIDSQLTLDEIDQQVIKQRLNQYQGNAVDAAKSLGLSRSAFYRRLEKYQIT